MKNMILNNLTYTGTVTLSQYKSGKKRVITKIKNSGGDALYNFFYSCFLGDFESAAKHRPCKIMLLKTDGNTPPNQIEAASSFIYQTSVPVPTTNTTGGLGFKLRYSFLIPREYVDITFNAIGLYPNAASEADLMNYSAFCTLNFSNTATTSASSVLVIDWDLSIS